MTINNQESMAVILAGMNVATVLFPVLPEDRPFVDSGSRRSRKGFGSLY